MQVRLLPYQVADGPRNMAADEVLLESAIGGLASLRFYGWSKPTVSLGYFQPEQVRRSNDRLDGLPYVRRPSGGATLVHHHEVTYALALPPAPSWHAGQSWLRRMHGFIARALSAEAIPADLHERHSAARFTGMLCFKHLTPGDLLIDGAKITGSAQRRQRGALLQHGAILLAQSPYTPELPGIEELTGRTLTTVDACQSVALEFTRQTTWPLNPGDWTADERARIDDLVARRYARDEWNNKR
jgi:lipoate-protein ligase A